MSNKRFARVIINNGRGDYLLIRGKQDYWNLPGGKVETGESYEEAARREVYEEIGITAMQLTEVYHGEFVFDSIPWQGSFFFADAIEGVPEIREPHNFHHIGYLDPSSVSFHEALCSTIKTIILHVEEQGLRTHTLTHT